MDFKFSDYISSILYVILLLLIIIDKQASHSFKLYLLIKWQILKVHLKLLFKKKIQIVPKSEYYSPYQISEEFYLLKIYKCSHQRFFKIVAAGYTTIIPECDALSITINGQSIKI